MTSIKARTYALGYLYAGASLHNGTIEVSGPRYEDLKVVGELLGVKYEILSSQEGRTHLMTINDSKLYSKLDAIILPPLAIPNTSHIRYFLSGYFDCRGGIFCDGNRRIISVISFKTFSMAQSFSNIMSQHGLRNVNVNIDQRSNTYYSLRYYVEDTRKLLDFLYAGSPFNSYQMQRYDMKNENINGDE